VKLTAALLIFLMLPFSVSAFDFAKPSEPSGKIIFSETGPDMSFYPVKLIAVNGENIPIRAHAVWLKPGEYELTLAPQLDEYAKKHMSLKERRNADYQLEIVSFKVVEGKSYYLAYDARAEDSLDWKPITYRVE